MRRLISVLPLTVIGALALVLVAMSPSFGRWNPATSGIPAQEVSQFHDWFVSQQQERDPAELKPAPCCGDEEHYGGDGRYVKVRSVGNGHYEVFVDEVGQWVRYPKPVNPDHPNPTGRNVAWLKVYTMPDGDGGTTHQIIWFCLRLAQGM